jgi:recombination protein RecA
MVLKINKPGQSIAKEPEKEDKPKSNGTSLAGVLAAITKEKGDKVFSVASVVPKVKRLPTGIFEFDLATGGGFPRARYSIVYGDEGSGKTNLALCAVAQAQRLPSPCNKAVWIDLEGTFDPAWAKLFGIDIEVLIVVRPAYGEEAADLVDALVRADDVACLVIDSVAALIGVKEVKRSAEDFDVGTTPLLTKRMTTKLVQALSAEEKEGHCPSVILLNQTRMKIGVMFGNPETQPGGKAMLFYSVLTVRLTGKKKFIKELGPDMPAFMETTALIKKAKVQVTQVNFNYDMCLLPHNGLAVGETDSWNNVSTHLKAMGLLKKVEKGQGWTLFGLTYPTLVVFQDKYAGEPEWALKCQQAITHAKSVAGFYLEGSGIDNGKG